MHTQVLGISVDSQDCLRAWAESLGGISYPLLSDFWPHGQVAQRYGVLRPEGVSERAIFVIDKQGRLQYVDVHAIGDQPDNEVLFAVLAQLEPAAAAAWAAKVAAAPVPPLPAAGPGAGVTVYCTPWCPDCRRLRVYLEGRGIPYREININQDRAAAQLVRGWANGYETTPTIDAGGTIVVGFDRAKLDRVFRETVRD